MKSIKLALIIFAILLSGCRDSGNKKEIDFQKVTPSLVEMDLSQTPTNEQLSAAGQLGGALVPTKPTEDARQKSIIDDINPFTDSDADVGVDERKAFGSAIQHWNQHKYQQATAEFDKFRTEYPNSPWASEATLHMGCNARFTGQYSEANKFFNEVIKRNKDSNYIGSKMMMAKAKSRLAVLRLMENNPSEANKLFTDVTQNSPDWRLKTYASNWLRKISLRQQNPGSLLNCGTQALAFILKKDGDFDAAEKILGHVSTNDDGFSIDELISLASDYNYQAEAVSTTVDQLSNAPMPAILQISRKTTGGKGHYWILEKTHQGIFDVFDPQMNRRFQFTKEQLGKEWQGYAIFFSKPGEKLKVIGNVLPEKVKQTTRGGCCGIQRPQGDGGAPGTTPDRNDNNPSDCAKGAPIWTVNMVNMNLFMQDIPLWYNAGTGPNVYIKLSYNTLSSLAQNEPFGNKWMFNYATYLVVDPGKAVTIFAPDGREDVFILNGDGSYHSDNYHRTSLTKNDSGQFVLTYASGTKRVYGVPDGTSALQYFLLEESDPFGKKLTFSYNSHARMTAVIDAQGKQTLFNYNTDGLISSVEDPWGRKAQFEYNDNRDLIALTDMQGYTTRLTYDDNRYISSMTDAKGTTSFYIEPSSGIHNGSNSYPAPSTAMWADYRITVTNPNGNKEEYYYDGYNHRAWYVDADNYHDYHDSPNNTGTPKTSYRFVVPNGRKGEISQINYPDNTTLSFEYYKNNLLKSVKDQNGLHEDFVWNDKGLLTKITDSLGNITTYTYADNGVDVVNINNATGSTVLAYNAHHQIIKIIDVDGHDYLFSYNDNGNQISATDAKGKVTQFVLTELGRISEVKSAGKTISSYQYDPFGRITSLTGTNGYTSHFTYNKIGSLLDVTSPSGRKSQSVFGTCPRMLKKSILPGNRVYTYEYDKAKQLTRIIDPMKGRVLINHTPSGLISSIVDKNSNQTSFTYTPAGDLSKKTYADGSTLNYTYGRGKLVTVTNARGIRKNFHYNNKEQLTSIDYSDGTAGTSYQYDSQGRPISVTDQWGETTFGYYPDGLLEYKNGPLSNDKITLTYNKLRQIASIQVGDKTNAQYEYDALGRINHINALGQDFNYQYDDLSPSRSVTTKAPNDVQKTVSWNEKADLAGINYDKKTQPIAHYQYRFNDAGKLAEQTGTPSWNTKVNEVSAQYNSLNQIVEWNGDKSAFSYDKDGNPIKGVLPGGYPFTAQYDAESQLTQIDFTKGTTIYSEHFGYSYNHLLTRYERFENGKSVQIKQFVRFGLQEFQQRDGNNQVEQEYAWRLDSPGGTGGLLITKTKDHRYQYVYNHLGSVQKVLDENGTEIANYLYTPYGQVSGSNFNQQPFGYSTKRSDFASGLVYFGYRFYAPNIRRWLNRDPLQEQGGINLYAYVNGDPLGYIDPDGLWWTLGDPLPQSFVNFSAGLGDALLLGAGPYLRNLTGAGGVVNQCSTAYDAGGWAALAVGGIDALGERAAVDVAEEVAGVANKGWKLGDDAYKLTFKGNEPSWTTVRTRFWKNEAANSKAAEKYGAENIERMTKGKAPQRYNADKGGTESMELSHEPIPARDGGKDFVPRWPQDHAAIDPFRRPGY